jgi:hypothetical protein
VSKRSSKHKLEVTLRHDEKRQPMPVATCLKLSDAKEKQKLPKPCKRFSEQLSSR